jgi:hypothetical protein
MKPSYIPHRAAGPRLEVPPEITQSLAEEFARERLDGLRGGMAWFEAFRARGTKIARKHGQSWADLYATIHRLAYQIIDAA